MKGSGSSVLITGLAIFDNLRLWIALPVYWLQFNNIVNLFNLSKFFCKFHDMAVGDVQMPGVYIIVTLTIFRVISVAVPHKAKILCSKQRALWTIALNIIFHWAFMIYIPLKVYTYTEINGQKVCSYMDFDDLLIAFWWVLTVGTFFPFFIILLGNIFIIFKMYKFNKDRAQMLGNQPKSSDKKSENQSSMNIVLISVSFLFVITTAPYYIIQPLDLYVYTSKSEEFEASFRLWHDLCNMLTYVNNVSNILWLQERTKTWWVNKIWHHHCISGIKIRNRHVIIKIRHILNIESASSCLTGD